MQSLKTIISLYLYSYLATFVNPNIFVFISGAEFHIGTLAVSMYVHNQYCKAFNMNLNWPLSKAVSQKHLNKVVLTFIKEILLNVLLCQTEKVPKNQTILIISLVSWILLWYYSLNFDNNLWRLSLFDKHSNNSDCSLLEYSHLFFRNAQPNFYQPSPVE